MYSGVIKNVVLTDHQSGKNVLAVLAVSRFHGSVVGQARASGSYKHAYSYCRGSPVSNTQQFLPILEACFISHIKIVEKM